MSLGTYKAGWDGPSIVFNLPNVGHSSEPMMRDVTQHEVFRLRWHVVELPPVAASSCMGPKRAPDISRLDSLFCVRHWCGLERVFWKICDLSASHCAHILLHHHLYRCTTAIHAERLKWCVCIPICFISFPWFHSFLMFALQVFGLACRLEEDRCETQVSQPLAVSRHVVTQDCDHAEGIAPSKESMLAPKHLIRTRRLVPQQDAGKSIRI